MSKIAAIQMCSTENVQENLSCAEKLIKMAVENDASLIVLPEMFAIMGTDTKDKIKVKEIFGQGLMQNFLASIASKYQIWLLGGTIPIASDNPDKIYAASILYNPQGQVAARYNKIHLFDVALSAQEIYKESDTTEAGNELIVVETPIGKLGLGVCYDIRFPEMFRYLFNQGAEIICLPSAFTVKTGQAHWEVLCRSRAIENFCYLIGAAQGGTHSNSRQTYGNSLIVNPWGEIIAKQTSLQPGVIYAELDLEQLHLIRKNIPIADSQKIFFDLKGVLLPHPVT